MKNTSSDHRASLIACITALASMAATQRRESFENAKALLAHLENLSPILHEMDAVSQRIRIKVHGTAQALVKPKASLSGLNPQWFVLRLGYK